MYICSMKKEDINELHIAIRLAITDFEKKFGVVIESVYVRLDDDVYQGEVARKVQFSTKYNEKE